jgi:hypothetical protein
VVALTKITATSYIKDKGKRIKEEEPWSVFVARDQGFSPAQTIIVPTMKFEAYYRYVPELTREISRAVFVARASWGNFHVLIILKTSK